MSRLDEIKARQQVVGFDGLDVWQAHAADDIGWLLGRVDELTDALRVSVEWVDAADPIGCTVAAWVRDVLGEEP